jgi:hypothetical protein
MLCAQFTRTLVFVILSAGQSLAASVSPTKRWLIHFSAETSSSMLKSKSSASCQSKASIRCASRSRSNAGRVAGKNSCSFVPAAFTTYQSCLPLPPEPASPTAHRTILYEQTHSLGRQDLIWLSVCDIFKHLVEVLLRHLSTCVLVDAQSTFNTLLCSGLGQGFPQHEGVAQRLVVRVLQHAAHCSSCPSQTMTSLEQACKFHCPWTTLLDTAAQGR